MKQTLWHDLAVFRQLFRREFLILKKEFMQNFIDALIWPLLTALVYGYIFIVLGLAPSYGSFVLVGTIPAICIYTISEYAFLLMRDFDGDRGIDYELTLPISPSMIMIKYGCAFAFHSFALSIPLLFFGKLFLYDRFDMSHFSFRFKVPFAVPMQPPGRLDGSRGKTFKTCLLAYGSQ